MSAQKFAGLAQGLADAPDTFQRQREAQMRTTASEQKLREYQQGAPLRASEQELQMQQVQNQLHKTQAEGLQAKTYSSFRNYNGDGNIKHLNNFLTGAKQNPLGRNMYGDVARYDNLENTADNVQQLKRLGVTDTDGFFEDEELAKSFVMATKTDGSKQLVDMDRVYAATGYTNHMLDQELEAATKRSIIFKNMQAGKSRSHLTALERVAREWSDENEELSYAEAYQALAKNKGAGGMSGTERERLAKELMTNNEGMSFIKAMEKAGDILRSGSAREREAGRIAEGEGGDEQEIYEGLVARDQRTTKQKSTEEITAAKDSLDKEFGGDFLEADLSDTKERRKAGKLIARIEQDFPLSTADRKKVNEIRSLTGLAGTAGEEITDEEAGPIDSMIRGVKKYMSNDIKGIKGTSAYEAYRNTLRHALYGATLSQGEIGAFNAAMGSLTEQKGPVLAKLRTSTEELQSQLQTIYDLNDEYVSKYRLNMSLDDMADVIGALDERLELIDEAGEAPAGETISATPPEEVPKTAADYFKRAKK